MSTPPEPPKYTDSSTTESTNVAAAFDSFSELIIGIDFGTTYTGVAYAHTSGISDITDTTADMRKAAEKVSVIRSWPYQSDQYAEKTRSILAYNTNPPRWGANVKPKDEPQVAHFKLGLQENVGKHYLKKALPNTSSVLGGFLTDHNWRHPDLPEKKAADYAADYLTQICQYVLNEVLPSRFGEEFLENQQILYVITVPAIWSDRAKELTRQAAIAAGISKTKLMLITEPEAAALFCATLCKEVDLRKGDRFLICDAGGGTVDLISYKVLTEDPFSVEECSVGTGAACGSIYLDQGFENLLRKRFGTQAEFFLTTKIMAELVRYFDCSIKRQFNPYDPACDKEFEVSITGVPDIPEIGLEDGYLKFSKDAIQSIFEPIFEQILGLINDQIENIQKAYGEKMKTIFLVGGLGSNFYLSRFLKKNLKSLINVMQPEAGCSAIMRGAVLYKLGLNFVKDRVMRLNYGVIVRVPFRPGYHPQSRRRIYVDGNAYCLGAMAWFAHKGQRLASGAVVEHYFINIMDMITYLQPGPLYDPVDLYTSDDDVPPEYDGGPSIKMHCAFKVDLRKLPSEAFQKKIGPSGEFYEIAYQIGLIFGAGGIELRYLYNGEIMGSVDCDYF